MYDYKFLSGEEMSYILDDIYEDVDEYILTEVWEKEKKEDFIRILMEKMDYARDRVLAQVALDRCEKGNFIKDTKEDRIIKGNYEEKINETIDKQIKGEAEPLKKECKCGDGCKCHNNKENKVDVAIDDKNKNNINIKIEKKKNKEAENLIDKLIEMDRDGDIQIKINDKRISEINRNQLIGNIAEKDLISIYKRVLNWLEDNRVDDITSCLEELYCPWKRRSIFDWF